MDLESKLSFTGQEDSSNVDQELLKSGIIYQNDPFQSIDERQEFYGKGGGKAGRKGSIGGGSTDKANKVMQNNFVKKNSGTDVTDHSRKSHQVPSSFTKASRAITN